MIFQKRKCCPEHATEILHHFHTLPAVAEAFSARGCENAEMVKDHFLTFHKEGFHDPYLFKDMNKAVSILQAAIKDGKQILVYGDYDVDGTMATSIMLSGLRQAGANVKYYIPQRSEGYGLNLSAMKMAVENQVAVIVTVDCGITAVEEVKYAKEHGIQVILTDHHEPEEILPEADAILDAKVNGETYPFKELCGAGVACKLIWGLCGYEVFRTLLDMAGFATVADVVPLQDENYLFVKAALIWLEKMPKRAGFAAMMPYCCKDEEKITAYHFGFQFGPMVNAAGRLAHAAAVVEMMTSNDIAQAEQIAAWLHDLNEQRKTMEKNILDSVHALIDNETPDTETTVQRKAIVLASKDSAWNAGVIGIAASQIQEEFHCPVILLSYNPKTKEYKGSGRSIEGVNLHQLLTDCQDLLVKFGGHKAAAGLTLKEENLDAFKTRFQEKAEELQDTLFLKTVMYDGVITVKDILPAAKAVPFFEPCGLGNPKPTFMIKGCSLKNIKIVGKQMNTVQCQIYDETGCVHGVIFHQQDRPNEFEEYDVVISPQIEEWNGKKRPKAVIKAMKRSPMCRDLSAISDNTVYGQTSIEQPIEIMGFPAAKNKQFKSVGINTMGDLLRWIPRRYQDFRYPVKISEMVDSEDCCFIGTLCSKFFDKHDHVVGDFMDDDGNHIKVYFFGRQYLYQRLEQGRRYILCGKPKIFSHKSKLFSVTEISADIGSLKRLLPVYKKIPGMGYEYLVNAIAEAFKRIPYTDYLEKTIVSKCGLYSLPEIYKKLHFPVSDKDIRDGQRRLAFDQLFRFNLMLKLQNQKTIPSVTAFPVSDTEIVSQVQDNLPYTLTNDQKKAVDNMLTTMQTKCLNALVQGDVGSGKTIVAFLLMMTAWKNGFQSVLMAPTEVLASQHAHEMQAFADQYGFRCAFLTGSTKAREKKAIRQGLADGSIHMVIGTHAVLQDTVQFQNLGLVIIDEQHRFGVTQRTKLTEGENPPHVVVMSATPIPRTLSMTMYGDNIQVETIQQMPSGRKPVITMTMDEDAVNDFILQEVKKGHQAYVICPFIDDAENMKDVKSVETIVKEMEKWAKQHPEIHLSNVTGKMKNADIQAEIDRFSKNETNVLISTTIVEVGVNIPNATVMVIKSSERFGLAQTHQLRGRVGRGSAQSYCILQPGQEDIKADILCCTTDGFSISKQDLLLRGPGDYIGTSQHGNNEDVMLMISEPELYQEIDQENELILKDEKRLALYQHLLDIPSDKTEE